MRQEAEPSGTLAGLCSWEGQGGLGAEGQGWVLRGDQGEGTNRGPSASPLLLSQPLLLEAELSYFPKMRLKDLLFLQKLWGLG